jgi:hypothetical protein
MNTNFLQGTVRGTVEPHKLKQPGSTPGPATNLRTAQRAIPTSGSEGRQRTVRRPVPTANQRPEFLDCQGGLFRAVEWERERADWRTRFAVVLAVAIAGWATVAVLVALV